MAYLTPFLSDAEPRDVEADDTALSRSELAAFGVYRSSWQHSRRAQLIRDFAACLAAHFSRASMPLSMV